MDKMGWYFYCDKPLSDIETPDSMFPAISSDT